MSSVCMSVRVHVFNQKGKEASVKQDYVPPTICYGVAGANIVN